MQIEQMKEILEKEAKLLNELAMRLDEDGEPLSTTEKKSVRNALASSEWFENVLDEVNIAFRIGHIPGIEHPLDFIISTVKSLV